jgi:hypothetical protein
MLLAPYQFAQDVAVMEAFHAAQPADEFRTRCSDHTPLHTAWAIAEVGSKAARETACASNQADKIFSPLEIPLLTRLDIRIEIFNNLLSFFRRRW